MKELFVSFFQALNDAQIHYAVTGRSESYPEVVDSDIDIVIATGQIARYWEFLVELKRYNIKLIQLISHEFTAHYSIISQESNSRYNLLRPDVCTDYYRNGKLFLAADELLKERYLDERGFYMLAPKNEFIYYLLKKIDKGSLNKEQFEHLLLQWNKDPGGCRAKLRIFFSDRFCTVLIRSFDNNDEAVIQENLRVLKQSLHQNLSFNLSDYLMTMSNKIKRVLRPTGLMVVFMGPDGAGKTTVIDGVTNTLSQVFRNTEKFHLFPKRISLKAFNNDPHLLHPRNSIGSLLKLFYFLQLFLFGYIFRIYPLKIRSTLVVFDRYYHDILVDPRRYRHGAGLVWLKLVERFIPKPDVWIFLNATANVIQHRKSEVSFSETERQVESYRALARSLKNGYIVDANRPAELVKTDVENILIDHLEKRTLSRYQLL